MVQPRQSIREISFDHISVVGVTVGTYLKVTYFEGMNESKIAKNCTRRN